VADHVTVVGHGAFFSDKARGLFLDDHGGGKRRVGSSLEIDDRAT
jgi:hypothetical protein